MNYPLLDIFWTMFLFFAWVAWIWLLVYVLMDIFRSSDLSGGAKALWVLFVFFIPVIGLLCYLIARGGEMQERSEQRFGRHEANGRGYGRAASVPPASQAAPATPAAPASAADQLKDLADARDRGTISDQEFEREKAKILA